MGSVLPGEDGEMSVVLPSVLWFSEGSGCVLCGVSEVDAAEVVVVLSEVALSERRSVSEAAGWLRVVLGFSVFALSESLAQLAARRAVKLSRQKARKLGMGSCIMAFSLFIFLLGNAFAGSYSRGRERQKDFHFSQAVAD